MVLYGYGNKKGVGNLIEVKNLEFTYHGSKEKTIKNIDFSIEKGEILGFLGPSGAGKSTTQKIITGILKNYMGSVKVMGLEIKAISNDYYENIGVSFELPNLYNKFTALENLSFFKSLYSGDTEDPLKLLSLVGLEKDKNTRVSDFSKGMKMRLNFCRSLLSKPKVLFLDEPTSGLDPVNGRMIKDIILSEKERGTTIFLTTHNMNVAEEICDRVAFIVDGMIKIIDSPSKLKIERSKKAVIVEYRTNGEVDRKIFDMKGIGDNGDFINLLKSREVLTIHTQEATLEDIFIEVTGRRLA